MKQRFRLLLIAILIMTGIGQAVASVSYSCYTGDLLTLRMEDESSTGHNIKNDLMSGSSYVVSSSWSCNDNSAVSWVSRENTYAYVKMTKPGSYTITHTMKYSFAGATRTYSYTGYYEITVRQSNVYVSSIYLDPSSATKYEGESFTIYATVSPSNATNKNVSWQSSNTSVATVDSYGNVTAKTAGNATITCKANDGSGVSANCNVTVKKATVTVTGISLSPTSKELRTGETFTISATVYPSNATDKSVAWQSSNTSVATVNSYGKVTAKTAGNATITCKANDGSGVSATCAVTVIPAIPWTGEKTWYWSPTSVDGGAVWGNGGYMAGAQNGSDEITGAWWGCGYDDGNCEYKFNGQAQHAGSNYSKYKGGCYRLSHMTIDESGLAVTYDNENNPISMGQWRIKNYNNNEITDAAKYSRGTLEIDEGLILWPFAINTIGQMPTRLDIGWLTDDRLILIYAGPGSNSWAECTWWSFATEEPQTGVTSPEADVPCSPDEFYTIDGRRVVNPIPSHIYIRKTGDKVKVTYYNISQ